MTWKGATDGGGATNQFCSVGNADLRQREARAGGADRFPLEEQPVCDGHGALCEHVEPADRCDCARDQERQGKDLIASSPQNW